MTQPNPAEIWRSYGEHAARLLARGPSPRSVIGERFFFVASGSPHVDLNQAALYSEAGRADALEIARLATLADVPVLLGCSAAVPEDVKGSLKAAEFIRFTRHENLFWMPGTPPRSANTPFRVRRMTTESDVAAMVAMFTEIHGYDPALTRSLFGTLDPADSEVSCWIAWDADEAVSLAFITRAQKSLGLWEVMTPVRHRRRGGARAVVVAGLDEVARTIDRLDHTVFWSSPAGRPLYVALGFGIADEIDVWVRGASEADLAAVGAG